MEKKGYWCWWFERRWKWWHEKELAFKVLFVYTLIVAPIGIYNLVVIGVSLGNNPLDLFQEVLWIIIIMHPYFPWIIYTAWKQSYKQYKKENPN